METKASQCMDAFCSRSKPHDKRLDISLPFEGELEIRSGFLLTERSWGPRRTETVVDSLLNLTRRRTTRSMKKMRRRALKWP